MQSSSIHSPFLPEAIRSVRVPSTYPPKHFYISHTFSPRLKLSSELYVTGFLAGGGGVIV